MENTREPVSLKNPTVLQSQELHEYILKTSVYPREPNPLKELRIASANHPMAFMGTAPDAGQLMTFLLKLVNPKKTIEIGVFTGYSLLLTALTIPDDGKITAIDINRKTYEIGLPVIKKARVEHKIDFIESQALPILDKLLEDVSREKIATLYLTLFDFFSTSSIRRLVMLCACCAAAREGRELRLCFC
ncbi:unnamed protein product [Prunus armeniaca]